MLEFFANLWESSTGNKIMLIAGALILIGAIAGVVYGVCS